MDPDASPGRGPADARTPLPPLVDAYESLLRQFLSKDPAPDTVVYELLLVRDCIAAAIAPDRDPVPYVLAERICVLDERLKTHSGRIVLRGKVALERLREVVRPPQQNWWWYPGSSPNPLWTIGAVLLLTISVTMITDFTRRML